MTLSRPFRPALIIVGSFWSCAFAFGLVGCDEPESDPVPIITTATPATTSSQIAIEPEDAGVEEVADAGDDAGKPKPGLPDPFRISRCCDALQGNKKNADDAQKPYYDLAINACNAARKNPALLYRVKQLLPSAPPQCQ
jgi:hypothetical protein